MIRTIKYTETIDYDIIKEKDSTKYTTYEKVKVKGVEGSQNVVAEVTVVDGVEYNAFHKLHYHYIDFSQLHPVD